MKPEPPVDLANFDLPLAEIRRGYKSDLYFWRSKVILENEHRSVRGLMQVFQKHDAVLCGIQEAVAVLKAGTGYFRDRKKACRIFDRYIELKQKARKAYHSRNLDAYTDAARRRMEKENELDHLWVDTFSELDIRRLKDGDSISPHETVLLIEGDLSRFVHLETLYLGALARRSLIATNVRRVVEAAGGKPVLYFPARFDHWSLQGGDGYAAKVAGAFGVSTESQASWWGGRALGTIPHALIAAFEGDTVRATRAFAEHYPDVNLISLVDFENNCVAASLAAARSLGERLWGVRLDTARDLTDRSLQGRKNAATLKGVCPELVRKVRRELDKNGFDHVRIVVSGGFDERRVHDFEKRGVPADAYGVGSSLMRGGVDFTADVVKIEGRPLAKVGRRYRPNRRLRKERSRI
jgi:nicotinate phosphoribosyltransferase